MPVCGLEWRVQVARVAIPENNKLSGECKFAPTMETAQTLVTAQAAPLTEALSAAPSPLDEVLNTAHALLRFFLFLSYWFYTFSRWLIAFATLTLPRYAYNILSWNLSLRIDFTKAASIILVTSTILSYAYKVKFLNRYTQLKETPLVLDEGFDL